MYGSLHVEFSTSNSTDIACKDYLSQEFIQRDKQQNVE